MTTGPWLWWMAAALASVLFGVGWRLGAVRAGTWSALTVFGHAAAISLVKAGSAVGYQHLVGLREAALHEPLAFAVWVMVFVATVAGAISRRQQLIAWFRSQSNRRSIVTCLVAGSLLAAAPSLALSRYASELLWAATIQLTAVVTAGLAAATIPTPLAARFDAWLGHVFAPAAPASRIDPFPFIVAGGVTLVSALLCLTSYEGVPHVPDEIVYLVQARYFALGRLWMPPPPVPAAFDTFLLDVSGDRWYGVFPPGWPLVLAVGVRLGAPFLINPVLGGACVILTYVLVRDLTDRGTARVCALLLAVSPWHLLMSMSFMSHVLSLALALIAAIGTLRAVRTGSWWPALVAGLALGVLGMSRPLEGVAVGLLVMLPLVVAAVTRKQAGALVGSAIGTAITGGLGLAYNRLFTGSFLVFPAERFFDREFGPGRYSIGFGPDKGMGWTGLDPFPGHGALDVGVNTVLNGFMINVDLFGWAAGSAAIVGLGILRSRDAIDRWMTATIATVVLLHGVFWFSGGPDFGARYWYLAIVPCAVLAARALRSLGNSGTPAFSGKAMAMAGLLTISALVLFVPWRAVDKYRYYRGVRADPVRLRNDPQFRDGLILVRGERHPDWAAASTANDVRPGASPAPVFAWDRDAATRRAVLQAYRDRRVWIVDGPSLTGRGYEIVSGPMTADSAGTPP